MGKAAQAELDRDVLCGFPNANAAPGWYGRLGWKNFGSVPLLIRPLRLSFLLGRMHLRFRALDFILVRARKVDAYVYSHGRELGRDFDRLWQRVAPRLGL